MLTQNTTLRRPSFVFLHRTLHWDREQNVISSNWLGERTMRCFFSSIFCAMMLSCFWRSILFPSSSYFFARSSSSFCSDNSERIIFGRQRHGEASLTKSSKLSQKRCHSEVVLVVGCLFQNTISMCFCPVKNASWWFPPVPRNLKKTQLPPGTFPLTLCYNWPAWLEDRPVARGTHYATSRDADGCTLCSPMPGVCQSTLLRQTLALKPTEKLIFSASAQVFLTDLKILSRKIWDSADDDTLNEEKERGATVAQPEPHKLVDARYSIFFGKSFLSSACSRTFLCLHELHITWDDPHLHGNANPHFRSDWKRTSKSVQRENARDIGGGNVTMTVTHYCLINLLAISISSSQPINNCVSTS